MEIQPHFSHHTVFQNRKRRLPLVGRPKSRQDSQGVGVDVGVAGVVATSQVVGVGEAASTPTPERLLESVTFIAHAVENLHALLKNKFS